MHDNIMHNNKKATADVKETNTHLIQCYCHNQPSPGPRLLPWIVPGQTPTEPPFGTPGSPYLFSNSTHPAAPIQARPPAMSFMMSMPAPVPSA